MTTYVPRSRGTDLTNTVRTRRRFAATEAVEREIRISDRPRIERPALPDPFSILTHPR